MKKIISIILLLTVVLSSLSGCSVGSNNALKKLESVAPMTLAEVAGTRLVASTNEEVESEIYNYVSDRIVVDGSKLIKVSEEDERNITNLLANINTQLQGKGGNVLTPEYANYLLLEFAKTPYEWSQSSKNIIGFDPAARLYFVDVTYSTISDNPTTSIKEAVNYKSVVPDSKIPNGHPDGDAMKQKRYTDYITMLTAKLNYDEEKYPILYNKFISTWGNIEDIFNEQQGVSLYERTLQKGTSTGGIGKLTYSGLVSNNKLNVGAKMTVRYVLKYALNLGEETDLTVEALYVKNYELDDYENLLNSYHLVDETSIEILKPFIDQLILSYNKCVEESNHIGLYSLFSDYATVDKYYDEIRDYTYNSLGGYNYRILERNGKEVVVRVDRINQLRARGAEMSLPTYQEIVIFNILLGTNDTIYIKDSHLVKRELIGEPLSVIKNVTGISEQIQYSDVAFSATNEAMVLQLIKDFSDLVAVGDYSSNAFLECVDLGISQNTLNLMAETIKSITPSRLRTYIVSWDTKTNVYCSVRVRQVFECKNGNFDTESVIDMGNRNGEWKVVNFTRVVNIKTSKVLVDELDLSTAFHISVNDGDNVTEMQGSTNKNTVEVNPPVERPETNNNNSGLVGGNSNTNNGDSNNNLDDTSDSEYSDNSSFETPNTESTDNVIDETVETPPSDSTGDFD